MFCLPLSQIYNLEKNELDGDSRRSSVGELILPAHAKIETRQYKPMQFEGSLGRLTSSSVHKPRQVSIIKQLPSVGCLIILILL